MKKLYIVKHDNYNYYTGTYENTYVHGYYLNKETAVKVAKELSGDEYGTKGNAYVDEVELNEE